MSHQLPSDPHQAPLSSWPTQAVVFTTTEPTPGAGARVGIFELVNVVLRRWRLVVGLPFAAALLAAVIVLIIPPKYTATASFAPETRKSALSLAGAAGLAGVAAELGVGIPGMDNSSAFYADVLESRGVKDSILLHSFPDSRNGGTPRPLLDILEITGRNAGERLELGRERLKSIVGIHVDGATNIVEVSVRTRDPQLSADIANRYVDLLNDFNAKTRETSGRVRREFAEARLAQAQRELDSTEAETARFMERNRSFQRSPELTFEYNRLQREIQIRQGVLTTLRQNYEEARIQEVNDMPLITVIDRGLPPGRKSSPRRTLTVVLSFLLGGLVGILGAFGADYFERARSADREHFEEARDRVGQLARRLRRLLAPGRPA